LEGWEIPNAPTSIPNLKSARSAAASDLVNAQVESVNIVGYQTIDLPTGYKMATWTFVPVGSDGTAIRLGDITPANFSGDNGDMIQFFNLNGSGLVSNIVTYYEGYGWCDASTLEILDNMTVPIGTGMFISSSQTDVAFTVAGEVALDSFQLNVAAGYTVVGNSSPVAITLGDIVPANFSGDNGDMLQVFAPGGSVSAIISYYSGYGWCDASTLEIMDDMVLNPGDAFFASCSQSNASFAFPAVL